MMKSKIVRLFGISTTVATSICLAQTLVGVQAVAQSVPAPNMPSGIYANQGHSYHWNNTRKVSCHVVGPAQLRLFMKMGVPSHGNAPFTPYQFRGGCLWPQGLYSPPDNQGAVMYINGSQQICHVSPSLFPLLRQRFGAPVGGTSIGVLSKGLDNIGTCPNPG